MDTLINPPSGAADVLLIKAVTDLLPDAGALTAIGIDTARLTAVRAAILTDWINGGRLDLILDAVKAVTDLLPDAGALTTIGADTARLTAVRAEVLTDWINGGRLDLILDNVLAETQEVERHIHNYERWFGPAAIASGEDHVADPLGEVGGTPAGVVTSFTLTSGANKTWGTAVQIFGATDAAVVLPTGRQGYFDLHRMIPTGTNSDKKDWLLRVIAGASAAAGVTADTYSIIPLFVEDTDKVQTPIELITEKEIAGTKMWTQLLYLEDNTQKTIDCQFAAHGYPA